MKCWNIHPNFKIPRRYQRTFMLSFGPNTHRIRVDRKHGLRYDCFGDFDFEDSEQMNRSLDWIQETIEGVRAEVER